MVTLTRIAMLLFTIIFVLFLLVGIPLLVIFKGKHYKTPTFTVESTTVKAYNLTSDNCLFCIINLGLRAHNPNPKYTWSFSGIDMEVRKGKHHKLADDAVLGFNVGPERGVLVDVEAVGLRVGLRRKIAVEVRADEVAGEGRVNVFMSGYDDGEKYLEVTCKNVAVDFSRSTVRFQEVKCKLEYVDNDNDDDYD